MKLLRFRANKVADIPLPEVEALGPERLLWDKRGELLVLEVKESDLPQSLSIEDVLDACENTDTRNIKRSLAKEMLLCALEKSDVDLLPSAIAVPSLSYFWSLVGMRGRDSFFGTPVLEHDDLPKNVVLILFSKNKLSYLSDVSLVSYIYLLPQGGDDE